jgi:hypothetical protein
MYHGLARRYLTPPRFLMRPLLNGGTLGGRRSCSMSLLPHRTLELRSGLSTTEAVDALANVVEAPRVVRFMPSARLFEGTVTGETFNIQRIIRYRNSSLPEIRGKIVADRLGCSISVTMTLPRLAVAFTALCFGGSAAAGLAAVVSSLRGSTPGDAVITLGAMLAFGWLLAMIGFFIEASAAERLLRRVFKATPWRPEHLR